MFRPRTASAGTCTYLDLVNCKLQPPPHKTTHGGASCIGSGPRARVHRQEFLFRPFNVTNCYKSRRIINEIDVFRMSSSNPPNHRCRRGCLDPFSTVNCQRLGGMHLRFLLAPDHHNLCCDHNCLGCTRYFPCPGNAGLRECVLFLYPHLGYG
jgi:hypothetical protein